MILNLERNKDMKRSITLWIFIGIGFITLTTPVFSQRIQALSFGKGTLEKTIHTQSNQSAVFNYQRYLFGTPSTLSVSIVSINPSTGFVEINGVDTQQPGIPFTWEWGDGNVTTGWFPQGHTYADTSRNYILTVISHYSSGGSDSAQALIRFIPPTVNPISLPAVTAVTIPTAPITLGSHSCYSPAILSYFGDNFFVTTPRSILEYVLSSAANIEYDFVNANDFLPDSNFHQVFLRDSSFGGAYAIWYSTPVAIGAGDVMLTGTPSYSSLFHEMGHNFTLNFPADFPYGCKIDGNANAIYSEAMAQIFQHAAGYELVNNAGAYGLSQDLTFDIEQSLISSIKGVRAAHDDYVANGCPFASWNDPLTPVDETFNTFLTIAYEFCVHAESLGIGYREPLKRMTSVLAQFDNSMYEAYDQYNNTAAADSFRATLMVASVSYAFGKDLRAEFRSLKFPIDDNWYNALLSQFPSSAVVVNAVPRWNLVSIPVNVPYYSVSYLFPSRASNAFAYNGSGYVIENQLNVGTAYWLKFASATSDTLSGIPLTFDSISVTTGWNLIGSLSSPLLVSSITSNPLGMITSQFFGYDESYKISDTLIPGVGYWVKVNQNGTLFLSAGSNESFSKNASSARIRIIPTSEVPPLPPSQDDGTQIDLPKEFALEQNYPNPFNPTTNLNYALPTDSKITLNVYNVLGQVVGTIVNGVMSAGYQSAVWNAGNVASGIYFYRIEATSISNPSKIFTQVRKMVLIK